MAKLILRTPGETEREYPLDGRESVTIGRAPDCEIPIQDGQASRRHCSVVRLQTGWELTDLGSTNGTTVNSTLVKKRKLRHGDVIRIGGVEIEFDDPESALDAGGAESCSLVWTKGPEKGRKIELAAQRTTFGRAEKNTVTLADSVASSFHCEIVRGLNGYTIRDLGSTNGTLVNGEAVTEAQLVHGAKVRIGNSRFVFQDPAMAEVDLDLAAAEDDEPEWGMLREMDLAAVRRRNPATIAYAVVFVLILAAGGYLFTLDKTAQPAGPQGPEGNRHAPYSFESAASAYTWDSEPTGAVATATDTKVHGEGASSLRIESQGDAEVLYREELSARNTRWKVEGKVASRGPEARLGILWTAPGLRSWSLADPVTSGSLQPVEIAASAPPWARSARLGVVIRGAGTVFLDDVAAVQADPGAPEEAQQNQFRLVAVEGKDLTLYYGGAPRLAKGRPVGEDARLSVSEADATHLEISVAGGGDELGVRIEDVSGFLTLGGFRAFGEEEDGGTFYREGVPEEEELTLDGVRKLLLGPKGAALAVVPAAAGDRLRTTVRRVGQVVVWSVLGAPRDGKYAFRLKTDLRDEIREANEQIGRALSLYQDGRFGEYLETAPEILAEFPFISHSQADLLRGNLREATRRFEELAREAEASLRDYETFKDMQSLDRVGELLESMRVEFQVAEIEGLRRTRYEKILEQERALRQEAERTRQEREAQPLLEEALVLRLAEGEAHSAAVFLFYVSQFLPDSPQAEDARRELAKICEQHPNIAKVLEDLK